VNPTRLRQIIINLVGNSIKFTERGEIALSVELMSVEGEFVELHFIVTDTGIGISPDQQTSIFEAFSQADASTTRKYGGTGLGLTICARLVGMMGGRIWVKSELGAGSQFHFTLRLGAGMTVPGTQPVEERSLLGLPVLVVDDNATNRLILERTLRRWGMEPTPVASAAAALAALQKANAERRPYSLVITDFQMPEMDGFDLVECIKQSPEPSSPAIIMLTSAGQRGDGAQCRQLGVSAYLIKPVRPSELRGAILTLVEQQAGEGGAVHLVTRHSLREAQAGSAAEP
jgi:two-component system sensor histidine kinase/response regulator